MGYASWRRNFGGVRYLHEPTGLLVTGAIDDLWVNKKGEYMIVDYKATAKDEAVKALDKETLEALRKRIDGIPTVSVHILPSWTKRKWTISISHTKATKQHAIFEVAKILGIDTHEIIAIGDGGNDLPLLMACGLKVAMGNAVEDLKEIADYVAPSVEEDGVAHVIEKFVLN